MLRAFNYVLSLSFVRVSHEIDDRVRACNEFDDTFNRFHLKSYHISEHRDKIQYKIVGIGKRLVQRRARRM